MNHDCSYHMSAQGLIDSTFQTYFYYTCSQCGHKYTIPITREQYNSLLKEADNEHSPA